MLKAPASYLVATVVLLACSDPPSPTAEPAKTTTAATLQSTEAGSTNASAVATATAEPTAVEATVSATASASADPKLAKTGAPSGSPTLSAAASVAPTAVASAPDVKGDEKKGASFSAYMSGSGAYKAGQAGNVTAVANALGDYHVNQEYPYKFTLNAAPLGVSYGETVVRNVSRSEKRAAISIPFTPSSAGTVTISGVYSLSVCTSSNCVIEKVPLSVTVKVE